MTTFFDSDAAIERLTDGMLMHRLPKEMWTHAAHFAGTLWLLRHRPDVAPERDMPGFIRGYNESVGGRNSDSEGYHETITLASIRAARGFLAGRDGMPLHAVVDALMASRLGDKNWLLDHWSRARLFSVEARRGWVAPDVQPRPFKRSSPSTTGG